jgi:hypothetical protein
VGTLQHDGPATPEQICLWLPVTGALPQTATAVCRYRRVGDSTWFQGHPLYRVQPSFSTVPAVGGPVLDGFAWPMIDLAPGTQYEVEVSVTAGAITTARTLTHATRALPPAAGTPNKTANSAATIASQLAALNPGDVLQIADGTYDVNGLTLSRSGTPTSPIYIRGQSRQGTVLRDTTGSIVSLQSVSNVVIENLTLIGSGVDSGTNASSVAIDGGNSNYTVTNLTVRNLTANGIDRAVYLYGGAQGVLVYDCTFNGNNLWTPTYLGSNLAWNDDGIHLTGTGNCAFNNTIRGFGDTFAYASHSGNDVTAGATAVHYYRNEIRNSCDDPIEVDHARRNCTWYDNRIHNSINCDSLDPLYGGPWLSARNITINPYRVNTHKWNDTNCGMFLYNNTVIGTASVGTDADVANWYQPNNGAQRSYGYRNNLHVYRGNGQSIWLESTNHDPIDWTHNSWFPDRAIQWGGNYASLSAAQSGLANTTPIFSGTNRRMQNDTITVRNPWTQVITLGASAATEYTGVFLPVLASGGTAKNTGVPIPNITDGFSGSAPDRGAIIEGRTTVSYGDRGTP